MKRTESIANRLQEVLLDGKWIAHTNFKEQITLIDWKQATKKVGALNTIALLTFHVDYYLAGILNVFHGGDLEIRDQFSFDMLPIESPSDWNRLREDFILHSEAFVEAVKTLPDDVLDKPFVKEQYGTYERNLEGVIEHAYYHLGQVSLIKKMVFSVDETA